MYANDNLLERFHRCVFSQLQRWQFQPRMSSKTALKESTKSTKATGKLWSEKLCCDCVYVECPARLLVNMHIPSTILYCAFK